MKPVGHLRRAWINLQDGVHHLEAAAAMTREGAESDDNRPPARAARRVRQAIEWMRPVLADSEGATYNDNGETPLELGRGALESLRRFVYCFGELGKLERYAPSLKDTIEALEAMKGAEVLLEQFVMFLEKKATP